MNNKSILAKARIIISVLTVIVCMLIGCERKKEIYLTQLNDTIEDETDLQKKEGKLQETEAEEPEFKEMQGDSASPEEEQPYLVVHICGAVVNPGVYELPEGSRLYQAVREAGGFTIEAEQDYLNQAQVLSDGMKLYIPTTEEVSMAEQEGALPDFFIETAGETMSDASSGLVNINTATEEELCTLSGIGSGKARSIIAYRTEKGRYEKIEDIMNVEGIKDGLFEKIKDSITV